jgi:coenzyme F420 hydrogenase subunit beta
MSSRSLNTFQDVVDWGLCVGCGACASKTTGGARMVHVESEGFRPVFDGAVGAPSQIRLDVCPSYRLDADLNAGEVGKRSSADHEFGPTLQIWEGWSSDPEIRFKGSSGGMLTALSLYCLEAGGFKGVIHAGMDPDQPWMNRNFISRTRADILARTGSRYAPSAPCAALDDIRDAEGPFVFIGKPCDAAAVSEMRRLDPVLNEKIGLVLTFFCAGTPSTRGTLDLVDHLDVPRRDVKALHYRGEGWPGRFRVVTEPPQPAVKSLSYQESWGRLTSYRPLRCNLCPDGLGRIADIACGDAWEQYANDGDPGRSLVLVRTERGHQLLDAARRAGYAALQTAGADNVLRAQANLLTRRRELFGRLLAFRLLGAPIPSFQNFSLTRSWLRIGLKWQVKTILGTLRRIVQRGWYRRRPRRSPVSPEAIHALSATK